ncbi:MCD4 [Sanghuangporus weigelae]
MLSASVRMSITWTLALGLFFHIVYIMSVFDCYFTSPVVHGMQHFNAGGAEAKRLILIVADGLRSDLLYNMKPFPSIPGSPEIVAPYLREIVETRGAFGVSHTRVPTESRPGHVAIIGGMYEDVSAVTKGWKSNPVDFDSVFNQSSRTFSFGSPDILPMFARGAVPGRVETWTYNEADEDFTRDATELDYWVLNQLQSLLKNTSSDASLNVEVRGDKVIFFLHLLGLDTTGHSYRPHSKEYMRNIQVVDEIVNRTEQLFNDFFRDDKTSYVFTADHGMSNIGNHGDGNPDSTRTPLIAWGAGVRGPLPDTIPSSHDAYSAAWRLAHLARRDVEQADIAPFMSTLLGINFPANSVGVLPDVDVEHPGYLYLNEGEAAISRAANANAKSILEHYRVKHRLKASRKLFFVPYAGLATQDKHGLPGSGHLLRLEQLLYTQKWTDVRRDAAELIRLSLDGLRYLETYDRWILRVIVTTGYVGWSAFSATSLLVKTLGGTYFAPPRTAALINITASCILLTFFALFVIQGEPWTYYLYVAFPCYFWRSVALRLSQLFSARKASKTQRIKLSSDNAVRLLEDYSASKLGWMTILIFASLQAMVLAYKHRSIWSLGLLLLGILWPILAWPKGMTDINYNIAAKWAAVCIICAVFPFRDVEQKEDLRIVIIGGLAMLLAGIYSGNSIKHHDSRREHRLQLLLILCTIFVVNDSVRRLSAKGGLPLKNQVFGWTILAASVLLPLFFPFRSQPQSAKLLTLFLAFSPCFILLSICAEGLFYLTYCATLVVWVEAEVAVRKAKLQLKQRDDNKLNGKAAETEEMVLEQDYRICADDVRIAVFFLFFVQVAFFGTGNVASISSFYLEPVYRLIPVFSPFTMAALLLFKIIAPYVILAASFASLSRELRMPPFTLFLIALSLTDGMTITFFLNVTDRGSWLEIGQTISFFVIASLLLLWSAGICALGAWLMRDGVSETKQKIKRT